MMLVSHSMAGGIGETSDRRRMSPLVGALLAMVAVMCLGVQAVHAQTNWTSISGDERRIVFYAPKLIDKIRRSHSKVTLDYSTRQEIATWYDMSSDNTIAGVYLGQLLGGYHYNVKISLDRATRSWNFFTGRTIDIGSEHSTGNKLGRVEYAMVRADNYNCVAFLEYFGASGHEFSSEGTVLLYGYYCADENQKLSVEEAKEVVRLLGVKDIGVPDRPPAE